MMSAGIGRIIFWCDNVPMMWTVEQRLLLDAARQIYVFVRPQDETLFEKQCWQRKINISVVHNYDALFVGAIWKDVALNELETIW